MIYVEYVKSISPFAHKGSNAPPTTQPATTVQQPATTTATPTGSEQYYYIDVVINNYGTDTVDLIYNVTGDQKLESAESMTAVRINLTIAASVMPNPITFKAYKQNSSTPVLLDGQIEVQVQPMLVVASRTITIGSASRLWHFIGTLVNQGMQPVKATFDNGTSATVVTVQPQSQQVQYFKIESIKQPPSYTVTAVSGDVATGEQAVMINGKSSFVVVGSESPKPTTLVLGKFVMYFLMII